MDTGIFSFIGDKREDFIVDKDYLLNNIRSKDFDDK